MNGHGASVSACIRAWRNPGMDCGPQAGEACMDDTSHTIASTAECGATRALD